MNATNHTKHTPGPWCWRTFGKKNWVLATTHSGALIVLDTTEPDVREGDTVFHSGCNETWMVAAAYENGDIIAAGWPCTMAKAGTYRVTKRCDDTEHLKILKECAAIRGEDGRGFDPRAVCCRDKLRKLEATP